MADKDSKTEKATPKRRKDERKEGNVFFSRDIVSVVPLLGIFLLLFLSFPTMVRLFSEMMVQTVTLAGEKSELSLGFLQRLAKEAVGAFLKSCGPVLAGAVLLPVLATGVQTRFLFTGKKASFRWNNLSPARNLSNMVSLGNLMELLKNLVKILVLLAVLYRCITDEFRNAVRAADMDLWASASFMLEGTMKIVLYTAGIFLAIAGFDYVYQRWQYERNLRMSKEEIKEEFKQTEGNPQIKGRIRDLQRQRARSRMMQSVPEADVVIRNPTHYAVALKYDPEKNQAPVVTAKGQDELALRIVRVAQENGVAVVENKPLARGLYAAVKTDQEIPPEYYGAVAELLVKILKMDQKDK